MIIRTTGTGRVQISAPKSTATIGLTEARRLYNELDRAIHQASIEEAEHLEAVREAHQRMAEALS